MTPNRTAPNTRIQTGRYQHNSVAGLVLPEMALCLKSYGVAAVAPPKLRKKKKTDPKSIALETAKDLVIRGFIGLGV